MDEILAKFRETLFDSDAIQAVILTNGLKIVWMSSALEKEFGPLEEFVGKTCFEAFAGDAEPHVDCTVRKTIESRMIERSVNKKRTYATVAMPVGDGHVAEIIMALPEEDEGD